MNRKMRVGFREGFCASNGGKKKTPPPLCRNLSLLAGWRGKEMDDARSGGFDDLVRTL